MKYLKTYEDQVTSKIYYASISLDRLDAFVKKAKKLKLTFKILNVKYEAVVAIVSMTEDFRNDNFKRYPYFNADAKSSAYLMTKYEIVPIKDIPKFIKNFNINKEANKYNL